MEENLPRHIGVILDGNRRFAKRLLLKPEKGHEWGAKKVRQLLRWCKELGIKEVTLFAFSLENFDRPKPEFNYLMNLFTRELEKLLTDKEIEEGEIKMKFIGQMHLFPKKLQELAKKLEKKTKDYNKLKLNIALAYSGRAEIVDAIKRLIEKKISKGDITEKEVEKHLYLSSEPDLVIRTSGEQRTSGFLLWQASYSELYFSKKLWPEFTKQDLLQAINSYSQRQRRFGK